MKTLVFVLAMLLATSCFAMTTEEKIADYQERIKQIVYTAQGQIAVYQQLIAEEKRQEEMDKAVEEAK